MAGGRGGKRRQRVREDQNTREKLLSLLYVQRRRDMRSPGLGEYEMARLLRIPVELVEFHIW